MTKSEAAREARPGAEFWFLFGSRVTALNESHRGKVQKENKRFFIETRLKPASIFISEKKKRRVGDLHWFSAINPSSFGDSERGFVTDNLRV